MRCPFTRGNKQQVARFMDSQSMPDALGYDARLSRTQFHDSFPM
jgi:hypothetical protein